MFIGLGRGFEDESCAYAEAQSVAGEGTSHRRKLRLRLHAYAFVYPAFSPPPFFIRPPINLFSQPFPSHCSAVFDIPSASRGVHPEWLFDSGMMSVATGSTHTNGTQNLGRAIALLELHGGNTHPYPATCYPICIRHSSTATDEPWRISSLCPYIQNELYLILRDWRMWGRRVLGLVNDLEMVDLRLVYCN